MQALPYGGLAEIAFVHCSCPRVEGLEEREEQGERVALGGKERAPASLMCLCNSVGASLHIKGLNLGHDLRPVPRLLFLH